MKLIKTNKQPSPKDPLKNGDRLYHCPQCEAKGYSIADHRIGLVYSDLMISKGKVKLAGKRRGAICLQCKAEFKVVGHEVILIEQTTNNKD